MKYKVTIEVDDEEVSSSNLDSSKLKDKISEQLKNVINDWQTWKKDLKKNIFKE